VRPERRSAARLAALVVAIVAAFVVAGTVTHRHEETTSARETKTTVSEPPTTTPHSEKTSGAHSSHRRTGISLDLSAHSTTDSSSIWVVVNKTHPIHPLNFRPRLTIVRGYQVAQAAARPLARLLDASDAARLGFKIASAFRSYAYQEHVHDALVSSVGSPAADRVSARRGHSEHQTGLAVDIITPDHPRCDLAACFATTPAGRWLAWNAWRYGFILRYTRENEAITGYHPEPWHIRYVGRPLAAAMRAAGITSLEKVFHVTGGNYRRSGDTSTIAR
jgi:zinc D-Ala-D-Ala carboxypeptidase